MEVRATLVLLLLLPLTWSAAAGGGATAKTPATTTVVKKDVYSSSVELMKVFRLEQEMVKTLGVFRGRVAELLLSLDEYLQQVEQLYRTEGCWPPETCADETLIGKVVANPIYCFQILSRLLLDWKPLNAKIKRLQNDEILERIKKAQRVHGGLPGESDLNGVAEAINRLHHVYGFDVPEFADGKIMGFQTGARLSNKDTVHLGKFSMKHDDNGLAKKWLETTAQQETSNSTVSPMEVDLLLQKVERQLRAEVPKPKAREPEHRIGVIPPQSDDHSKHITQLDEDNLGALCRGVALLPRAEASKLTCYLKAGPHPYHLLRPQKVEVVHREPHEIVIFHDAVSHAEADELVRIAIGNSMQRAKVGNMDKEVKDNIRLSRNSWIEDDVSPLVDKISLRINRMTGLQTTRRYDRDAKREEYEALQVANYGVGGHYGLHQDPFYVYSEPWSPSILSVEDVPHYVTGDRCSTFMLYLSEVPRGGHTAFPRLGVSVSPIKGAAIFWHNIRRSGRTDMHMLHSGCPVVVGSKWVANKWVREFANMFTRKCEEDIDK